MAKCTFVICDLGDQGNILYIKIYKNNFIFFTQYVLLSKSKE